MKNRVVITGLGVVSSNGVGIPEFRNAIQKGISGIQHLPELEALNFECTIGGVPTISEEMKSQYLTALELRKFSSNGILFGVIAGMDAWKDAGLPLRNMDEEPDWDSGGVMGIGSMAADKLREGIYEIDSGRCKRLGSTFVIQTMPSGINAYLVSKLGLGNHVTTNSSACATGTESILMAYDRIKSGRAKRMLACSTNDDGPYVWAGFDAMRVTTYKHNHEPEKASQPMGEFASGFAPGCGAGAMVLESLESALERGAEIYAEVLGGQMNSGGQRLDGSMTLPNSIGVQRCIKEALENAEVKPEEIDVINGHLTSTGKCNLEIQNWAEALNRKGKDFPHITALKSMIGHALGAAGTIESVAAILQIKEGFLIPNINCENIDPKIKDLIDESKITRKFEKKDINIIAKSSFGFGDVNACVIFKKYQDNI